MEILLTNGTAKSHLNKLRSTLIILDSLVPQKYTLFPRSMSQFGSTVQLVPIKRKISLLTLILCLHIDLETWSLHDLVRKKVTRPIFFFTKITFCSHIFRKPISTCLRANGAHNQYVSVTEKPPTNNVPDTCDLFTPKVLIPKCRLLCPFQRFCNQRFFCNAVSTEIVWSRGIIWAGGSSRYLRVLFCLVTLAGVHEK